MHYFQDLRTDLDDDLVDSLGWAGFGPIHVEWPQMQAAYPDIAVLQVAERIAFDVDHVAGEAHRL